MPDPDRALDRCMGGRWCRHLPGTCTATAGPVPPLPGAVASAVPLPTAERDPADEHRARAIAFGLYALDAPLGTSIHRGWDRLDQPRRDLLMARARFVLSMAGDLL